MGDAPNGSGRGVAAYRWWISVGMTATLALVGLILTTVRETASDVTVLKISMGQLTTTQTHHTLRLDAQDRRNDLQDQKIDALQQRVWQLPLPPPR